VASVSEPEALAKMYPSLTLQARISRRKKCLNNNVSSLNSLAAMVDEINNFPAAMFFSWKSSWLEARLILNLLRLASAPEQLKPARSAWSLWA
jgi:hypothetical protein